MIKIIFHFSSRGSVIIYIQKIPPWTIGWVTLIFDDLGSCKCKGNVENSSRIKLVTNELCYITVSKQKRMNKQHRETRRIEIKNHNSKHLHLHSQHISVV